MTLKMKTTNRRARVVLVGSGRMGQIRASILYSNPRFDLCGIVDINLDGATDLANKYHTKAFATVTEAICLFGTQVANNDGWTETDDSSTSVDSSVSSSSGPDPSVTGIDAVIVSSPTFTHKSIVNEVAPHGIFIFTEKPVDETVEGTQELFDICHKTNSVLCCGFQRRFDHSYAATQKAIAEGSIGKALMANLFFADHPCPPIEFLLKGGNIFMDLLPHDFDFIRWCLQDDVVSVYATGTSSTEELEKAGVHDNATVVTKFKKGAVVTFTLSRSASYGYDQRCEVFGEKGLITVGNEHLNTSTLSNGHGVHASTLKHSFPQRFNQAFTKELDAFADCILNEKEWTISTKDCVEVQKIADAARKSCELGVIVNIERGL